MSLTSEKHRAALEQFSELLSREAYEVQLVPAGDDVPFDTLLVKLELVEKDHQVLWLELSFLPGLEAELDDVSILQCYVALSEFAPEHRAALERLIVEPNSKLPIGGFGLLDEQRVIFFKHNAMLPNDDHESSLKIVHELVAMTGYLIEIFSEQLLKGAV